MLRLERAMDLSLTLLTVFVYWRSADFVYRWLPIVYCGGPNQGFYHWYSLLTIAPVLPFVGMMVALLLARRSELVIVRRLVAAASTIAAVVIARIFGEMTMPLAWGDCFCCGGPTPAEPRDLLPPLVLQLSPVVRTEVAIGVLAAMSLGALLILILELRAADRRMRYLGLLAASLAVLFCLGWLFTRLPGFIWWTDGWCYVAVASGIAAATCVVGSVTIVRKSAAAFAGAVLLVALSYVVIYHAVGLFAIMGD